MILAAALSTTASKKATEATTIAQIAARIGPRRKKKVTKSEKKANPQKTPLDYWLQVPPRGAPQGLNVVGCLCRVLPIATPHRLRVDPENDQVATRVIAGGA